MKPTILIISCEHGSNKVPKKYSHLFENKHLVLQTRHAYDLGTAYMAKYLHKTLHCDLVQTKVTRLLIDANRAAHHLNCFSKYSKKLSCEEKKNLFATYYDPFYQTLEDNITAHIAKGEQVLHLSLYSFAPIFKGLFLNTAVGLLYDTKHHGEKEVARMMGGLIQQRTPHYKIRHNDPFLGSHDFVLKKFRKQFSEKEYLGIKLGVNQVLITKTEDLKHTSQMLEQCLHELLQLL